MSSKFKGILALVSVSSLYGMYGVFSRMIGEGFGAFSQNWIRNLFVIVIILFVIRLRKVQIKRVMSKDFKWVALWMLCGSWVTVLTFIAFNHLNIGTTYLIIYTSMLTSGYISGSLIFKEKLSVIKIISFLLAVLGFVTVFRFNLQPSEYIFAALALLSGGLTGFWNTLSKKFSDNYDNNQIVLMDSIAGVVAALIGVFIFQEALIPTANLSNWVWLLIYGIVQTINVGLVVYGFNKVEAQLGSLILPIEIIFAMLFGYLFFSEIQSGYSVVGLVLIIAAAILPNLRMNQKGN